MKQDVEDGVSLQISVAPRDLPHARQILPHQLRQWGGQVDEVVFTLDLGVGRRRRWSEGDAAKTHALLAALCDRSEHSRVELVDYGHAALADVGRSFFAGKTVPLTDCYGKAVYPYFFGLLCARRRYVLHMDSDMMFGGGSQVWTEQARSLLSQAPEIFTCSPLPGPPAEAAIPRHVHRRHARSWSPRVLRLNAVPFLAAEIEGPALRFSRFSSRVFFVDRSALTNPARAIRARHASVRNLLGTAAKRTVGRGDLRWADGETMLARTMKACRMLRVDFLGRPPGMWSLHPPVHSEAFHRLLPDLIGRIETGDIPIGQRGDYDLNDSMVG